MSNCASGSPGILGCLHQSATLGSPPCQLLAALQRPGQRARSIPLSLQKSADSTCLVLLSFTSQLANRSARKKATWLSCTGSELKAAHFHVPVCFEGTARHRIGDVGFIGKGLLCQRLL